VLFRSGRVYYFDPKGFPIRCGDAVIAQTSRGQEFGRVVAGRQEVSHEAIGGPLKPIVRLATRDDLDRDESNRQREREAVGYCYQAILRHELPMKLVAAEYTFDRSRLTFHFSAEGRVDFRELVRELASVFRTRIEMHQIGVRDEAKLLGGYGTCGRELCCARFLRAFDPVAIRMAKDQGLSLNPTKISGACGRLMCCLRYEHETYVESLRRFPKEGSWVKTPRGCGQVCGCNVLSGCLTVRLPGDRTEDLSRDEVEVLPGRPPEADLAAGPETAAPAESPPARSGRPRRQIVSVARALEEAAVVEEPTLPTEELPQPEMRRPRRRRPKSSAGASTAPAATSPPPAAPRETAAAAPTPPPEAVSARLDQRARRRRIFRRKREAGGDSGGRPAAGDGSPV
jgi:cell fate regulator YaaT (PSP1 superfamily)